MWHLPLEDIKLGVKMHKKKKSVGDNKKSIIAVLFIGAGCALAAAIACSFFVSDLSNNNRNLKKPEVLLQQHHQFRVVPMIIPIM